MGYTFTWDDLEKICRKLVWKDMAKALYGKRLAQME
jgi:hypothetical protein